MRPQKLIWQNIVRSTKSQIINYKREIIGDHVIALFRGL